MNSNLQPLLESFPLRSGIQLKNRIVLAPMTHMSSHQDGTVSNEELAYYARRSGGAGMVITACTYVTPNGKGFPGQFAADSDEFIPSLRRLAASIKEKGAKAVLQIFHGGRLCPSVAVPNGDVVSASAIPSEKVGSVMPRALTEVEIEAIIHGFGEATRRAIEAGFDGVEIHGANGYLVQQFFSPHSNQRHDRYGGSVEKRLTFPLALVDEVLRVVKAHAAEPFLVGYRFSPEEAETPGITMEETFVLIDALADKNLDYLHVSLNDFWSIPKRGAEGTRSRMEIIQERVGSKVAVIGVGAIATADQALKALQTGVPLIALGRAFLIEPDWVEKVKEGKESEIATSLKKEDQERLAIPDPLWNIISQMLG
jgi:2,4-dienoyl-CoA reductase-like NADH-dependent reductase (Old Yellow Enzyme family)